MHSTIEASVPLPVVERPRVYLTCVLCREAGIIEYPVGLYVDNGTAIGAFSGRSVLGTVCHHCMSEDKNRSAVEYYVGCGIAEEYIRSTLPYFEAFFEYNGSVRVILNHDMARVTDISSLMNNITDECTLYSLDYDDNRMFEQSPEYWFFGLPRLSRWLEINRSV
jgi:hypothetical protein